MSDRLSTTTTRTPLVDVDTSRFDLGIEKACALIDRLQAEKAALLKAVMLAVVNIDCERNGLTPDGNVRDRLVAAIAKAERA